MTYFNLDLMEQDAKRRLKKHIDEFVKTELADMAKKFEPKLIDKQLFVSGLSPCEFYNRQFSVMNGFWGYVVGNASSGGGFRELGCL
jgi:hypothetical protein